jgi:hypothetical protein
MGFNTTVFLLNDRLSEIKANPQRFVDEILSSTYQGNDGNVIGQTTVMPSAHADIPRLYITHRNGITDLSYSHNLQKYDDRQLEYLAKQTKLAASLLRYLKKDLKKELQRRNLKVKSR